MLLCLICHFLDFLFVRFLFFFPTPRFTPCSNQQRKSAAVGALQVQEVSNFPCGHYFWHYLLVVSPVILQRQTNCSIKKTTHKPSVQLPVAKSHCSQPVFALTMELNADKILWQQVLKKKINPFKRLKNLLSSLRHLSVVRCNWERYTQPNWCDGQFASYCRCW